MASAVATRARATSRESLPPSLLAAAALGSSLLCGGALIGARVVENATCAHRGALLGCAVGGGVQFLGPTIVIGNAVAAIPSGGGELIGAVLVAVGCMS